MKWTVQGYYPNVPLFGFSELHGITQYSATEEYPVTGTEDIYKVLERNGVIEDPMTDANTYKCEWVANRWWVYRAAVTIEGEHPRLRFEALDGVCRVYFKNRLLACHANSYVPLVIDMEEYAGQSGILMVMVENQTENLNQSGYTSKIASQRPRFDSKWDFCPRMVSLGIVAPVYIETGASVREVRIVALSDGTVNLDYTGEFFTPGCRVRFEAAGQSCESAEEKGCLTLRIPAPRPWSCGREKPALYRGKLCVFCGNEPVWEKSYNIGFRTVEFVQNEDAPAGSLPYTLVLNGEKTYIKGVNLVPIEMSRASFSRKKYEELIRLAKGMNVNFIRIWGGGVIETEDFYDLCDEYGILVWQDFMQSSSGIDNCATVSEEGLKNIAATAECAVKRLRNHPSLAVYCGGNELMDNWVPLDYSHPNIAMLREIVDREDGTRMMFPTTASGGLPNGDLSKVGKGIHHDIHGPWTFTGNEAHYRFYNEMDSLLHAEFGADGFCNPAAAERMLSEGQRKMSEISENYVWRHKAEWWDPMPLSEEIFGKSVDLEEQIWLSQFIQAEALRYAIEANRRRAFNNSGSIIWQFDEPYPNLCCTNIIDYFCEPKAAYYAARRAYAPVNPNMKYSKMYYAPGETFRGELYLTSDEVGVFTYRASVRFGGETREIVSSAEIVEKGKSVKAGTLEFTVPERGVLRFTLTAEKGGQSFTNRIMLLVKTGEGCSKAEAIAFVKQLRTE